jgi:hypothetical protein
MECFGRRAHRRHRGRHGGVGPLCLRIRGLLWIVTWIVYHQRLNKGRWCHVRMCIDSRHKCSQTKPQHGCDSNLPRTHSRTRAHEHTGHKSEHLFRPSMCFHLRRRPWHLHSANSAHTRQRQQRAATGSRIHRRQHFARDSFARRHQHAQRDSVLAHSAPARERRCPQRSHRCCHELDAGLDPCSKRDFARELQSKKCLGHCSICNTGCVLHLSRVWANSPMEAGYRCPLDAAPAPSLISLLCMCRFSVCAFCSRLPNLVDCNPQRNPQASSTWRSSTISLHTTC